jgi:hypothetical protein
LILSTEPCPRCRRRYGDPCLRCWGFPNFQWWQAW